MSFFTALTGLNAATSQLAVTSNNIANTGTTGFKRSRAEFGDIFSTSPLQKASGVTGQGTIIKGISQVFSQGNIQFSENVFDMAITGEGFFALKPTLTSIENVYTRAGSFRLNNDRFLVDGAGQYLRAFPVNEDGSVRSTAEADAINVRIPDINGIPKGTDLIEIGLNLPGDAAIIEIDDGAGNLESGVDIFDPSDKDTYNHSTSTTIYDSLGNPAIATLYYQKITNATTTGGTTSPNVWNSYLYIDGKPIANTAADTTTANPVGGPAVPQPRTLEFDTTGALVSVDNNATPGSTQLTYGYDRENGSIPFSLNVGYGASTQFVSAFSLQELSQNGFPSGRLDGVDVEPSGVVRATYSNGDQIALGKVMLVNFPSPNGLKQLGDANFITTAQSGEPVIGEAGGGGYGTIQSGALERANVDLTQEMVDLITAQRGFQSNAKALETSSSLSQTIMNIRS